MKPNFLMPEPAQTAVRFTLFAGFLILGVACGTSLAQDLVTPLPALREDAVSVMQADKARLAEKPGLNKAEAVVLKMESIFLIDPSGFYPYFGSVYQGGGITAGVGYRRYFGDNTFWNIQGLYSALGYKLLEGGVVSKDHFNQRLSFGTRMGWRDATQVPYYGLGQKSKPEDRANFRFQETYVDGTGSEILHRGRRFPRS
jgi:hypothetical protein